MNVNNSIASTSIRTWRVIFMLCMVVAGQRMMGLAQNTSSAHRQSEITWGGGWLPESEKRVDEYAAFRGAFTLDRRTKLRIEILGAHWFQSWIDEQFFTEGPARFPLGHAEYEVDEVDLDAGTHVLSALVHNQGISTRLLRADIIPPFLICRLLADGKEVDVRWKVERLEGYKNSGVRISPQFAWIEWVDTKGIPRHWQAVGFDDSAWQVPAKTEAAEWKIQPLSISPVRHFTVQPKLIAAGLLSGPFEGTELPNWKKEGDVSWYGRNLHPGNNVVGVWRRYDLGKVRLGSPRFLLDLPANSVVEFAYSEALWNKSIVDGYSHDTVAVFKEPEVTRDPRVIPYIPLSGAVSRNLDHYVAQGGVQTFSPLTPKGGRYLEVHIQADPEKVKFLDEEFTERSYYGDPLGRFECSDALLNRIWMLGIKTLRGCAEDAVIDNPTRERGQWTGDVMLSMYIAAAGYNDVRLFKRAIQQSAYCAREDGMVAGLSPGGPGYLSSYAAQWVTSVLNYFDLTGDSTILEGMYPYAVRNTEAFEKALGTDGVSQKLGWAFIDWGYVAPDTGSDIGLNLHVLESLRNMIRWSLLLGKNPKHFSELALDCENILHGRLDELIRLKKWEKIGYHCTVLAYRSGFIPPVNQADAREFIKRHIMNCFPNNLQAPRLSDPGVGSSQLITPYFSYYAFPILIENGDMDFVLGQYRTCWGWAMNEGLTTQPEVFDLGWSHCHVWASSPTAQLSKYILGLVPCFSQGLNHFRFELIPGSLDSASGSVPFPNDSGTVTVHWHRVEEGQIAYEVQSSKPIWMHAGGSSDAIRIEGKSVLPIQRQGNVWILKMIAQEADKSPSGKALTSQSVRSGSKFTRAEPITYPDRRPYPGYRLDAKDQGRVLLHGDGPDSCDYLGAREAIVNEVGGTYYLYYDGAGPNGWIACLAVSKDLVNWGKRGPALTLGNKGEDDAASASSPWVYNDGKVWHMFYLGTPHSTPRPDLIPSFPYLTLKAKGKSPAGPWTKQKDVNPFRTKPGTYYSATASPGQVIKHGGEYLMFFSASTDNPTKRTLSIARTKNLDGQWTMNAQPIVPPEEQVENSSIYYEPANRTWFLFTNHIGLEGIEFTDAIWVYWSKDLNNWDSKNKAVVLDGKNCTWSSKCIGMPSVVRVGDRLAILYDAPGGDSKSHMRRDIGLAWLQLPLKPPD